jgi:pyridoxamine 5'-phosphate oxidase
MKEEYTEQVKVEDNMTPEMRTNPWLTFETWFKTVSQKVKKPNAFCLATADAKGQPSARFQDMTHFDNQGIVWQSNYQSKKGQ